MIGSFDGTALRAESEAIHANAGANFYAARTWSDAPDGRRIQIAWISGGRYPGMPFNQQMSFPCDLFLRTTPRGIRLCCQPAQEIETLRLRAHIWQDWPLKPGDDLLGGESQAYFMRRIRNRSLSCSLLRTAVAILSMS
ncbi:MAG: hypothetical protein IT210_10585 [Armatimonadetes bacterium]|nr:hypothetical protein [Armatimonadota bacterium]